MYVIGPTNSISFTGKIVGNVSEETSTASDIRFVSKATRMLLYGRPLSTPKLHIRSVVPRIEGCRLGSYSISALPSADHKLDNESLFSDVRNLSSGSTKRSELWSLASLSYFLRELFPDAAVSDTVSEKEFWRVPSQESFGFRRAIALAKVKVMTIKQAKLGADRLKAGLDAVKGINLKTRSGKVLFQNP